MSVKASQYEKESYEWRKNSESKDPNYCGSCSLECHVAQVRDPDSWVSESMLNHWKAEWEKDNAPTELEAMKKQVRDLIALYFAGCDSDTFDDAMRSLEAEIGP